MANFINPDAMQIMLKTELQRRIDLAIDDEMVKAKENIDRRIRSELGTMALSLLKRYEVEIFGSHLKITIQNEVK